MKFLYKLYLRNEKRKRGFTLIEMLVSVAIFTLVMLITTSSIFVIVASNKKAEALKSVMDNLSFALESMTRNIRTGSTYTCLTVSGGFVSTVPGSNCPGGDPGFQFLSNQQTYNGNSIVIQYYLWQGRIWENQTNSNWTAPVPITAPEINVSILNFYLVGAGKDGFQPRVLMSVIGTAGTSTTETQFDVQTTLSQRQIDD